MRLTDRHRDYWKRTRWLTVVLLVIWFAVTFGFVFHARAINAEFTFLGFPLAFYMGAQGSLIVYLLLVWVYARTMERLDRRYQVDEGSNE